jgi:hypothetical protein
VSTTTRDFGRGGHVLVVVEWRGRRLGKKGGRGTMTTTMEEEKLVNQSWQSRQQSNQGNWGAGGMRKGGGRMFVRICRQSEHQYTFCVERGDIFTLARIITLLNIMISI